MSKRSKRHSITKRNNQMAQALSKKYLIGWVTGNQVNTSFTLKGDPINVSQYIKDSLRGCSLPWSSYIAICCRDQQGNEYIQSQMITSKGSHPFGTLADTFNKYHQQLIEEGNPLHLVSCGWIASPVGLDISDEIAETIMSKLGCWRYPSKWENDQTKDA